MDTKELLRKVRQIEISIRGVVNEVFAGEYHSVFKGRGMEFAEVREYQTGDDVRSIDWNVSARMNHPYVKVYDEERELTVMILFTCLWIIGKVKVATEKVKISKVQLNL